MKIIMILGGVIIAITAGFIYWYVAIYDYNREFVIAAANRDIPKLESLIAEGKYSIDGRALDDWTALTLAANKGYKDVVEFLIEHGADVNAVSGGDKTALFWAKRNGHKEVVELLKKNGAKISTHDK